MRGLIEWIGESVRKQDYFGMRVSLTFRGESKYKSVFGGCVTIVAFTCIAVQSLFAFQSTFTDPLFKNLPATFNYDFNETFEMEPKYNVFSFKLIGNSGNGSMTQDEIDANLRVTFKTGFFGKHIPAMYCDILFSKEIAAEKSGESDSNFFTNTYGTSIFNTRWICPNIGYINDDGNYQLDKVENKNIRANIVQCEKG